MLIYLLNYRYLIKLIHLSLLLKCINYESKFSLIQMSLTFIPLFPIIHCHFFFLNTTRLYYMPLLVNNFI